MKKKIVEKLVKMFITEEEGKEVKIKRNKAKINNNNNKINKYSIYFIKYLTYKIKIIV